MFDQASVVDRTEVSSKETFNRQQIAVIRAPILYQRHDNLQTGNKQSIADSVPARENVV